MKRIIAKLATVGELEESIPRLKLVNKEWLELEHGDYLNLCGPGFRCVTAEDCVFDYFCNRAFNFKREEANRWQGGKEQKET